MFYKKNKLLFVIAGYLKMNNEQYHKLVNEIMFKIESYLDENINFHEIDCEINHNILYVEFKNKNQIIINKQEYLQEIWVATKNTGYHFKYQDSNWICKRTNINFWEIIEKCFFLESQINFCFN